MEYNPSPNVHFSSADWRPGMTGVIAGKQTSLSDKVAWPILWDDLKARTHPTATVAKLFRPDGSIPVTQDFLKLIS